MEEEKYFLEAQASALSEENARFKEGLNDLEFQLADMEKAWDCKENKMSIEDAKECIKDFRVLSDLAEKYRKFLLNSADAYKGGDEE